MIKITTDSTCDLPRSLLERYHISVTPLGIVKNDRLYRDGIDIRPADIARHVDAGGDITTTSAVNIADYEVFFREHAAKHDAVIHLNIGSASPAATRTPSWLQRRWRRFTWWIPRTSPPAMGFWCWLPPKRQRRERASRRF